MIPFSKAPGFSSSNALHSSANFAAPHADTHDDSLTPPRSERVYIKDKASTLAPLPSFRTLPAAPLEDHQIPRFRIYSTIPTNYDIFHQLYATAAFRPRTGSRTCAYHTLVVISNIRVSAERSLSSFQQDLICLLYPVLTTQNSLSERVCRHHSVSIPL